MTQTGLQAGPIVEVRGLSVSYGHRHAARTVLRDLDLDIAPGETIALVGESGSGKTTAANALIGLLPGSGTITSGQIRVLGDDITHTRERRLRAIRGSVIGLVPQDPMVALNPTRRVGASVAEAVKKRGPLDKRQLSAEVIAALERAGLDHGALRARQYPHELSGGMRQRVLIAIALAGSPKLLIADEPTSALDVTVQRRILDHVESLVRETGISMLLITHDLGVAADRADRVVVLQGGRVVEQGLPADILVSPRHEYTRRLIEAVPGLTRTRVLGASQDDTTPAREILRLESVSKDFPLPRAPGAQRHVRAVDKIDLTVRAGQTVALVGESGAGKPVTGLWHFLCLASPSPAPATLRPGERARYLGRPIRRAVAWVRW
jgi:peptide/nickel transport system ATP-binding protein